MAAMRTIEDVVAASGSIPGWIEGEDARELALASLGLPSAATIIEVGVYMGRSTVLLAGPRRMRGSGVVHSVDPFDCSGDAFSVPHYREGLRASGRDSLEEVFRENLARLGLEDWVEVHRATARDVVEGWSQPVDLLVLDGDQSPAGARAAYEAWIPFLAPGGIVVLRNTRDREYAEGHDGYRRLSVEEIGPPRYRDVRRGETTFAVLEALA
jgi:hypothetical protein